MQNKFTPAFAGLYLAGLIVVAAVFSEETEEWRYLVWSALSGVGAVVLACLHRAWADRTSEVEKTAGAVRDIIAVTNSERVRSERRN